MNIHCNWQLVLMNVFNNATSENYVLQFLSFSYDDVGKWIMGSFDEAK